MLPEAYDYNSLLKQLGPIPAAHETDGLPAYLLENSQKFGYLLPGGCRREEKQQEF